MDLLQFYYTDVYQITLHASLSFSIHKYLSLNSES